MSPSGARHETKRTRGDEPMQLADQRIIPAVRSIRDYEAVLQTKFRYVILLDSHVAQLQNLMDMAREARKRVIIHADLVQGLKPDEAGAQFLCQSIRPAGVISTHSTVIQVAKKRGLLAIQRIFLLDSHSLETSFRVLTTSRPDVIEVLPGVIPDVLREVKQRTNLPILAGGFIRTKQDILRALQAGADAITTSKRTLWEAAIRQAPQE
jgi:glycerol uptake operon antiterminator